MEEERERLKGPLKPEQLRKLEEFGLVVAGTAEQIPARTRDKRRERAVLPLTTKKEDITMSAQETTHTENKGRRTATETMSEFEANAEKVMVIQAEATQKLLSEYTRAQRPAAQAVRAVWTMGAILGALGLAAGFKWVFTSKPAEPELLEPHPVAAKK